MTHNNYVIVKKGTEVLTDVLYADTFDQADVLRTREMLIRAAEEGDNDSEWIIATVQPMPVTAFQRRLFRFLDWVRERYGS